MPDQIAIEESTEEGRVVLDVSGEIDLATAPQFETRLGAVNTGGSVVVDLTNVTFIDSTGLRVLISAHEKATEHGGRLAIVATEGPVTKLLAITGVDEWLNVYATRSSATEDG